MNSQSFVVAGESLLEVDHIFICVEAAPTPALLRESGLVCLDDQVQHPEQGTTSLLIFFENTYLELIWIENAETAEIYAMRSGIDFLARAHWQQTQASPFGIALRQKPDAVEFNSLEPWTAVNPLSDRAELFIHFAISNLVAQTEPLCFVIPEPVALTALLDLSLDAHQRLVAHPLGMRKLTQIHMAIEQAETLSDPMTLLVNDGVIMVKRDYSPCLELTFDDNIQGQSLDLRQLNIPMVLKY